MADTFFETVLDVLSQLLPQAAIVFFGQDSVHPAGNFLLHKGLVTDAVVPFVASLAVDNPWLEQQWGKTIGRIYQDDDLVMSDAQIPATKVHQWNNVIGPFVRATGMVVNRQSTRQLVLEIRFPATDDAKLRREATELLKELSPHIVRAAQIMCLTERNPVVTKLTDDVVELFPFPMLIIDAECQVRCINEQAEILADKIETFFISAENELHAVDLDAELEFRSIVQRLSKGHRHNTELFSLPNAEKTDRIFFSITKLGYNNFRRSDPKSAYEKYGSRLALVVQDTKGPLKLSHRALWNAYKLTNAEAELSSLLLAGCSIGECAHKQGLAKQTLRNHLGSIMKKTETHRQPQLVALLTRLALSTIH
ncbi:MAG: DNA-binding CsgD family transcriptional regulator [Celeribacter sp.]|jgi:DNA-binding CsgD family transcriptional regulator